MSLGVFSAKFTITNSTGTGDPSQFIVDADIYDGAGIYTGLDVAVNDIIFLDTTGSGVNPGNVSRYKVLTVNSQNVFNVQVLIQYIDTSDIEDPINYVGYPALICRSSPSKGFAWLAANDLQGLPSYLIDYARNSDIFSYIDNLSVTGPQGIQGATGLLGTQGETGLNGIQGLTGIEGLQGFTGLEGPQGITGIQGSDGVTGLQGIQGNTGTQGIQGITGSAANADFIYKIKKYNNSGSTILQYSSVYELIDSSIGLCDLSDLNKEKFFGIALSNIPNGVEDYIQFSSIVPDALNGSGYINGTIIYMGSAAGEISSVAPTTSGYLIQKIGKATNNGNDLLIEYKEIIRLN